MTSPENPDWKRKLQELEVEINSGSSPSPDGQTAFSQKINQAIAAFKNWYDSLPNLGKAGVAIISVMVAFSLLNTVLHLVASLLSIVVLASILYLVYRFSIASRSSERN
jgi:hypothetical protein